jgi:branched-chain amino acid transport system substrate-binding protein
MVVKCAAGQRGIHKFAVLAVDSDYGRGAGACSKKYLPESGDGIVSEDHFKDGRSISARCW